MPHRCSPLLARRPVVPVLVAVLAALGAVLVPVGGARATPSARSVALVADAAGRAVPAGRALPAQVPGAGYVPIVPARVADTRVGQGGGALGPDQARDLQVAGSPLAPAVPADAVAVVLNLTAVDPSAGGYLTAWPAGRDRPLASNLNFGGGQTVASAAVVGVGRGGAVAVFNLAGTTHVVVDVVGFVPAGSSAFTPVLPGRVADTRDGLGGGVLATGETRRVAVAGLAGVPAGAAAVALTVTAVDAASAGWLSAYPAGGEWPGSSTVNFTAGGTVANATVVGLGGGAVDVRNGGAGPVHLVVDVTGWFGGPAGAGSFVPVRPARIADTRTGSGGGYPRVGESRRLVVAAKAGVPAGAAGVVLNVTADRADGGGFVTVWPGGSARPLASSVNFVPGPPVANLVVAGLGPDGTLGLSVGAGRAHLVVDVLGYVTGPPAATRAGPGGRPPEEDWLGWLNRYRTGAGLAPVSVDPALAVGGEAHGRYLVANNVFTHDEDLSRPYASAEGDSAGRSGNLYGSNCARLSPRRVIEGWLNSTGHALWMVNPRLRVTGYAEHTDLDAAASCGDPFQLGWAAVLDVLRGRDAASPVPSLVRFPGDGQTVEYRPTRIYATFPSPVSGPSTVTVVANGQAVPLADVALGARQGDRSSNTVVVGLAAPLPPGRVGVSVQAGGQSSSWSFTVAEG